MADYFINKVSGGGSPSLIRAHIYAVGKKTIAAARKQSMIGVFLGFSLYYEIIIT